MPYQSPYGNLTATLVVVAFLDLVIDRLLGHLFLSPACQTGISCLLLRGGPFLMHLTGALALIVGAGGILGHLRRAELFPRGMRLTVALLSATFWLLVTLFLLFGRIPERYQMHLQTSFGFVVALLALSFVGSVAPARMRVGFGLFALPTLMHIAASVAVRGGWLSHGPISPERLISLGELGLLLAAFTSPLLLLPAQNPTSRLGAGLALAAGVSAFFFVAFLGRADLVQTVALYGVQLELPRAMSTLGAFYVMALFGFVTTVAVLLLSAGPFRLSGLGICLIGLAGYQASSPVSLGLSLCGLLALATGLVRANSSLNPGNRKAPLSAEAWKSALGAIASAVADAPTVGGAPVLVEVLSAESSGTGTDANTGSVKVERRGWTVTLKLRRTDSMVRDIEATVGTPGDTPPDATIESHEAWLGRREQDRVRLPRMKSGDPSFDRKLGVHGRAPVHEPALRRRLLRLAEGTITLWTGRAARFVAPGSPTETLRRFAMPTGAAADRAFVDLIDTLIDLIDASQQSAPPDAA